MRSLSLITLVATSLFFVRCSPNNETRILVFSKTEGFRHQSIPDGIKAFQRFGDEHDIIVDTTENADRFNEKNLKQYDAVVFLNTTGDVLDHYQQADFERYIQAEGRFMGVHAAADTEYNWPWYGKLVGAYFQSHPEIQEAKLKVIDHDHPSTEFLPDTWVKTDEWYNYYNINPNVTTLITLDESSYEGGENGDFHPNAWYHEYDGGRAFYTGGGHTSESYSDSLFLAHLWGGLRWILDDGSELDYSLVNTQRVPEENRFSIEVLDQNLTEPTELEVLNDHRVIYIQRRGEVKLYDPVKDTVSLVVKLDVYTEDEDGLMGLTIDPDFENNHWIYLYYSPPGNEPKQQLSRFKFIDNSLDLTTEEVILEVPTQRDECCHTGGSLEWDADGNLYISTGDDTNPFASNGYAPIDERPGRSPWDAQKSSSNTNDLRGKILRIHPEPDGTYSIPEGNLFPEGTPDTRPEIYVMGTRNPYRISIDQKNGILYWGEVGPDAGSDSTGFGPKGHDEVNQAKQAGFFGWPYFVGNNKPYWHYNFSTGESDFKYDPQKPLNVSPNNTGLRELPPAREAFIWYPYSPSEEFPLTGQGGRNAMAGPVFYSESFKKSEWTFPEYYDSKLFIYDWMRGWILVVTMDQDHKIRKIEPFMPSHKFSNPMDMVFGPDGSMYLLEYGTKWYSQNEDARLVRIKYNSGNRAPIVVAKADKSAGAVPHRVQFSSAGTQDYDGDALTYQWDFDGESTSTEKDPEFVYENPGIYTPTLTVTDEAGNSTRQKLEVLAGNEPPEVSIEISGNQTFFWDNQTIEYKINVRDKEDGSIGEGIDPEDIFISIQYLERGFDKTEIISGHQAPGAFLKGKRLMDASDCNSCHQLESKSIGPSYRQIADRYKNDENAIPYLADKVIKGGGGVWGDQAMAAHPQISSADAEEMVKYIMSLGDERIQDRLPPAGTFQVQDLEQAPVKGAYYIMASYNDHGKGNIRSLSETATRVLSYYQLPASAYSELKEGQKFEANDFNVLLVNSETEISYNEIDLSGISSIDINGIVLGKETRITMSLYLDGNTDTPAASSEFVSTGQEAQRPGTFHGAGSIPVENISGVRDLRLEINSNISGQPAAAFLFLIFQKDGSA